MKKITILGGGRFISDRDCEVSCYYDSQHQIIKTPLEHGGFAELTRELQSDGSYRTRNIRIVTDDRG